MGLDYHGLAFLRHVRKAGDFGATATIGRQELHLNELVLRGIVPVGDDYAHHAYCEPLLERHFGASKIESLDNSSFENATHIHDMNAPLPAALCERYDTVLDIGTLEHIFDIVQALKSCSDLCRPGGQIVHVLPANNYCGHGFWQFSPELFFSLYSPENGYRSVEVIVADYADKTHWYRVRKPVGGRRVNIHSATDLYVMVRAVRADGAWSHAHVQQSDYMFEWEHMPHDPQPMGVPGGVRGWLMRSPLYDRLFPFYHRMIAARSPERLTSRNPGLEMLRVADMIR